MPYTIKDYIDDKRKVDKYASLDNIDISVLKIPYPFEPDWLIKYGHRVMKDWQIDLIHRMNRNKKKKEAKKKNNVGRLKKLIGANSIKSSINPSSDDFLNTFEWRKVRMIALKNHGAKCQCCGATPEFGAIINVDHIKPRKTHPELALDINNLQVLCHECNHGKGNWDATDWRNDAQSSKLRH